VLPDVRETFYHDGMRESGPRYAGFDLATAETAIGLSLTYDLLHQCQARYMLEFGLSKSAVNILLALQRGPAEGMLLHDLGELLLVSRANITGLIDHLEEKGYVTRVVDASDRRGRFARITSKAEAFLEEFMPVHNYSCGELLQGLSSGEKSELAALLRKVRDSIRAHAEVCERHSTAKRGQ
jgi:MarR family 2-MHQ and catechol resistance regulon transcriptional repressor